MGRNRIRAGLRQRGVSREVAEEGLKQAMGERSEQDVLDAVARRLLGQHSRDDPKKRLLKVFAALVRRGFPPGDVRQRLVMLRKEAGAILDGYQFEASEPEGDVESEDG